MPEILPASVAPAAQGTASSAWDVFRLIALCVIIYGAGLGRYALNNPDEGRYAEIPREMLATGDYVTPRLNGVKYFEKPPLAYWLVAGCLRVFGPGETAARATPALFALLGVVLLYAAARRLHGRETAWWSALVLATSLLYFAHARILLIDMVVAVLISAVLICFLLGVREPVGPSRRWLFYGLYASAALATLAKGLIGFLLPGAVMFFWLLLFNQWRRLRPFYLPTGLVIFAAIAAPWHLLVAQRNPEWAWFYFVHEHWLRFTTTTHGRYEPWWFFLPVVVLGLFPWTGFLWPALRQAATGGWTQRIARADDWFPVLWAGFILLFFSASQSKLVPYVLPVFPPLAWLVGRLIADLRTRRDPAFWRWPLGVSALLVLLLGLALVVVVAKPGVIKTPEMLAHLRPLVWPAALTLVAAGAVCWWLGRQGRPQKALLALLAANGMLGYTLILAAPVISRPGTKSLAEIVAREADANDLVLHYHEYFHDFSYYARRTAGTVAADGELEVFLDADAQHSGRFLAEADLRKLWTSPRQVFLVLRRRELPALQKESWFRYKVLGEEPSHLLLSNHY
jgi:4-amino-4-deoxy-L-arabinose transferase-like glycosyltransferase